MKLRKLFFFPVAKLNTVFSFPNPIFGGTYNIFQRTMWIENSLPKLQE